MLCAVDAFQEIKAGLIDQAMGQKGIALREDRLAYERGPLADDQQPHTVLAALQSDLPDPADDPLGFTVEARAEGLRDDRVSFFQDDENLARLAVGPGPRS